MSSIHDYLGPGRRMLARRLDQLCTALECLSARLRSTIANVIGETIGGFVTDSTLRVLDDLAQCLPDAASPPSARNLRETLVKLADEDFEQDEPCFWSDESDVTRPEAEMEDEALSSASARLPAAISTGLQAAAWCLRRWSGRTRMLTTLAVGFAAGGIAYIGGPLAAGVLSLAGAATQFAAESDGLDLRDSTPNYRDP